MYYPWWYVPGLTAPMLIAIVALVHVFVSHYAVGGGILLALENRHARRIGDDDYRGYWKSHLIFFILLTVVFGAVTGVGIWWTIGLTSPLATELLIQNFVFGWAMEWCFFILEVVAAFAFYYYWDKMKPRPHAFIGWIYAFSAWISLVLITGITAFMLNSQSLLGVPPADSGTDIVETFWYSFLNRQFIPQTIARTGAALVLATFYVYCHASWVLKDDEDLREKVVRRMRVPSLVGLVLLTAGVVGWFFFLPSTTLMMLERAAVINLFLGLFAAIVFAITVLFILGPMRSPRTMSLGFAVALLMFGIAGVGTGEFIREAVRKPFIVDGLLYGNQIYTDDVPRLQKSGFLAGGTWTKMYLETLQKKYPDLQLITATETPVVLSLSESSLAASSIHPISTELEKRLLDRPSIRQTQLTLQPQSSDAVEVIPLGTTHNFQPIASQPITESPVLPAPPTASATPFPTLSTPPLSTSASEVVPAPVSAPATGNSSETSVSAKPASVPATLSTPDKPAVTPLPDETVPAASIPAETATPAPSALPTIPGQPAVVQEEVRTPADGPIRKANPQKVYTIHYSNLLKVSEEDRKELGRCLFLHHCNDCHAAARGYSAVGPMITDKTKQELQYFITHLNRPGYYMPPWSGNDVETELLADYLLSIRSEKPKEEP